MSTIRPGLVVATITTTVTVLLLVDGAVADAVGPRVVMPVGDAACSPRPLSSR